MDNTWVPLAEAAQRLSVSWERAWRLMLGSTLSGEKRGGRWWVRRADVERVRTTLAKQATIPV